jgi:hypothetical protein
MVRICLTLLYSRPLTLARSPDRIINAFHHNPILHLNDPIGLGGNRGIVGDDHDREGNAHGNTFLKHHRSTIEKITVTSLV